MIKKNAFWLPIALLIFGCSTQSAQINRTDTEKLKALDAAATKNIKTKTLCTGWYYVIDTINDFKYQLDKTLETYYLDPAPITIKDNIEFTEVYKTDYKGAYEDYTGLSIQFDTLGTARWAEATGKATFKKLAFVIDNKLIVAATVNGKLTMGKAAINRTVYNLQDIEAFKRRLDK